MATFNADKYTTKDDKPKDLYSDFRNNFRAHPGRLDLLRLTNEDAIKQSITNLLKTNHYERPFQPYLGANLSSYLFELIDSDLVRDAEETVEKTIHVYEPRAKVLKVTVSTIYDDNALVIKVVFAAQMVQQPITLEVILNRVR